MMELWTGDMVRFMKDASEYGSYNRELAALLRPHLNPASHICDAGCGLGYLSLALAPFAGHITAVEINSAANAVLKENCEKLGVTNITPRLGAIAECTPEEKYDAMVFCFFGGIDEILEISRQQCKGDVFVITRNYSTHRFSVGQYNTGSYGRSTSQKKLDELGIAYTRQLLDLEFGQPFRSLEDARQFYESYSVDTDKSVITDDFLHCKLRENDHPDFPWYMPHQRSVAILHFCANDIP